jgi:flagellar hook assembly protein FlgD
LPKKSAVSLRFYDVRGRLVRAALVEEELPAGEHQWVWDGRNGAGVQIGPGVYFVRLSVGDEQRTTKSIVLP